MEVIYNEAAFAEPPSKSIDKVTYQYGHQQQIHLRITLSMLLTNPLPIQWEFSVAVEKQNNTKLFHRFSSRRAKHNFFLFVLLLCFVKEDGKIAGVHFR